MAAETKTTKSDPAPKKSDTAKETPKTTDKAADTKSESSSDSSGDSSGGAPKNYSRGEGQKPVTQAYKDNWNAIFAKKKKKR